MLDLLYCKPIAHEMKRYSSLGVPAHMMVTVAAGVATAFAETHPRLGEVLTDRFFEVLRTHPMIREPDACFHPEQLPGPPEGIRNAMSDLIGPLFDLMGKVRRPVERNSTASTAILAAFQNYADRALRAEETSRHSAVIFNIWLRALCPSKLPSLGL